MSEKSFEELTEQYQKEKKAGAPAERMIGLLLNISQISYEEQLLYELALWYWKAGYPAKAKRVCKQIRHFFHEGPWVERANETIELVNLDEELPTELEELYLTGKETIQNNSVEENKKPGEEDLKEPEVIREAFKDVIGMESIRREMVSFYNVVRLEKLREQQLGIKGNTRSYNFVLYGDPGTGKTTVARIIGKVLYALGIRENDKFLEVDRSRLVSEHIGGTEENVRKALEAVKGGTLFIDEAYSLYVKDNENDFGHVAINTLLKHMEDNRTGYSVILAGYRTQMTDMLKNANPGFRSRFTYHIVIPDYSDEELLRIADKIAAQHHYTIEKEAYEALKKRIDRERVDETFGNARFIRDVIEDAEKNLANRLSRMQHFSKEDLTALRAEDIFPEGKEESNLSGLLEELNDLTGFEGVKKIVADQMGEIAVQKEKERRGIAYIPRKETLHMAFMGNAGTGKTTAARLLGKIFAELGILKRGDIFVEAAGRSALIGQYQGHTAARVKELIRSALGGVLFIDEAYSLHIDSGDTFGQEAVDTLVAEMDNHRDSLIVILAGYKKDMELFMKNNQGLRSRVPTDIYFEDYTSEEMLDIFCHMAQHDRIIIPESLLPAIKEALYKKSMEPDFGNGRGVRNIYETVRRRMDVRIADGLRDGVILSDNDFFTLKEEDIVYNRSSK